MKHQTRFDKVIGWTGVILYCVSAFITISGFYRFLTSPISITVMTFVISFIMLAVSSYLVNYSMRKNVLRLNRRMDE